MPKVIKPEDNEKRVDIMEKILKILGKKEGESDVTFFLSKMDLDEEKQKLIYELEVDIKKYYICGTWTCFAKDEKVVKRKWLSMIKYICKEHGKDITSGRINILDEEIGKKKEMMFYRIKIV
jgi:hypothetical protein